MLDDTGVPGAGIALVRLNGVEWAGGIGMADRDRRTPVTADTHFRAGSISKTFVAMALVQLSEDDQLDLDTPVAEIVPDVRIENAWDGEEPVRVIHLLQHTAGFDDLHFNELFNLSDPPDMALVDVLRINPRSRVVRWRPGTRFSYSNPAYAVAAHIVEKISGKSYEDFITERTFDPIGMRTSSFRLTAEDEKLLAKGYDDRTGPPVAYNQIYLRPSGNLHTSPAELGKFVQVLLNWGETPENLVIDPEYLSNMEHPRTTLASDAGLRSGYGTGIHSYSIEGFPMLGHTGGIAGFSSSYGYSTSRDVGYVVLLNGRYSTARDRISRLAVRYLKADVDAPPKPQVTLPEPALRRYEGYYHEANPRNQYRAFSDWLSAGHTITVEGTALRMTPVFGEAVKLTPVSDNLFRFEDDVEATRVFATDDRGTMVLAGSIPYSERRPRWQVELVRVPVMLSMVLMLTPLPMLIPWAIRAGLSRRSEGKADAPPAGFWWLKTWLVLGSLALIAPAAAFATIEGIDLGTRNVRTGAIFVGTALLPASAVLAFLFTIHAWRSDAGKWLRTYALVASLAALIVSTYLGYWGMLFFRFWAY